ncbi:MAG TPA: hypothetical protein VL094_07580 [Sphingomonadaceae bacterium]|nr:hypothetical protein [Sphingomonadaceae bacterium]
MGGSTQIFSRNGVLDAQSEDDFEAMLARLAAADDPRLLLFVHGGLVAEDAGRLSAWIMQNAMHPLVKEGWETAFLIWRSGLGETIDINWPELRQNSLFIRIMLRVIRWLERRVSSKDALLAVTDAVDWSRPLTAQDLEAVMAALDSMREASADEVLAELELRGELAWAENADGLNSLQLSEDPLFLELVEDPQFLAEAGKLENQELLDPEVREAIAAARAVPLPVGAKRLEAIDGAGFAVALAAARAGWRVLKRYIRGRDHGLGPTVVEEICGSLYLDKVGAVIWGAMKDDARQHFLQGGAAARLMQGLDAIASGGKPVRVLLIGHSAGSVFTANWAAQATALAPQISTGHIMLAPAIRMDEAADLYGKASAQFEGMRIFTMHDTLESANHLDGNVFGKIYHRSLPYLISGVLERNGRRHYPDAPLLGLERHHLPRGKLTREERRVLDSMRDTLAAGPDRIVYSVSNGPDGRTTASEGHGGYYSDPETVQSILHIARHGFT